MPVKRAALAGATALVLAMTVVLAGAQSANTQGFEEAVSRFERRDYAAAARGFERIAQVAERPLAARALVYLGNCYERLNDERAVGIYRKVVDEYGDQQEPALRARQRLTALESLMRSREPQRLSRPLWKQRYPSHVVGRPSRNGAAAPSVGPDGLLLLDLATGMQQGPVIPFPRTADGRSCAPTQLPPALSPDAKTVALFCGESGVEVLHVVALQPPFGARPLVTLRPHESGHILEWAHASALVFQVQGSDRKSRIQSVNVLTASTTPIAELPTGVGAASLSPDGQWLAFDGPVVPGKRDRTIWMVSTNGGTPYPATSAPLRETDPHWTPDGRALVFVSVRTGSPGLWMQGITGGKPVGAPRQVAPNIGPVLATLGLTQQGQFVYWVETGLVDVQLLALSAASDGQSRPTGLSSRTVGQQEMPTWSPDGDRIAFVARDRGVVVRNLATGAESSYGEELITIRQPRFSPDGHAVLVRAWDAVGRHGYFSIDLRTSRVTTHKVVSPSDEGAITPARWSHDGRSIIYGFGPRIMQLDVTSSTEQTLHTLEPNRQITMIETSYADGSIAYAERDPQQSVLSVRDGNGVIRRIRQMAGEFIRGAAWLPDNKALVVHRGIQGSAQNASPGLWRVDLATGSIAPLQIEGTAPRDPSVSPDGRQLAYTIGLPRREIYVLENFLTTERQDR